MPWCLGKTRRSLFLSISNLGRVAATAAQVITRNQLWYALHPSSGSSKCRSSLGYPTQKWCIWIGCRNNKISFGFWMYSVVWMEWLYLSSCKCYLDPVFVNWLPISFKMQLYCVLVVEETCLRDKAIESLCRIGTTKENNIIDCFLSGSKIKKFVNSETLYWLCTLSLLL